MYNGTNHYIVSNLRMVQHSISVVTDVQPSIKIEELLPSVPVYLVRLAPALATSAGWLDAGILFMLGMME